VDDPEADKRLTSGPEQEPGISGHAERLGQHLADLYNENTILRERVRVLEQQMRAGAKSG
jgi:hypothetical protein